MPTETTPIPESFIAEMARTHGPQTRISLLVFHRSGSEMIRLREGEPLVLGREAPSDICIRDGSLSRQHARFEMTQGEVWVEDLRSTNGTHVNGQPITREKIRLDDEVIMGSVSASLHALAPFEGVRYGLEGHERFREMLDQEIVRAKHFGRKLAVMMVRASREKKGHLGRWCPRIRTLLSPVDGMALYSGDSVEICVPEAGREESMRIARAIIDGRAKTEPPLLIGLAIYPDSATSAEELIAMSRSTANRANNEDPIAIASVDGARTVLPTAEFGRVEDGPIADSPATQAVFKTVERIGRSAIPVLIQGETGVGKEVVARAIHEASPRCAHPMVCVNCAAIPANLIESTLFGHERGAFTGATQQQKGVFEAADGGTVFLDEIGELPAAAQAALLRVLETKRLTRVGSSKEIEVDVRIIAATHRDLEAMCHDGSFRWDLLYRLNVMSLAVPPLRKRQEDIPPLAERFMREANERNQCSIQAIAPEALQLLCDYRWPGNVRELRNAVERAVVIAQTETIGPADLPDRVANFVSPTSSKRMATATVSMNALTPPDDPFGDTSLPTLADDQEQVDFKTRMRQHEVALIEKALAASNHNQTDAAKRLQMPLRTLVHKIKVLGIKKKRG